MIHARARCWIHEDCLVDLELAVACGPNPPDAQVLDADWAHGGDGGDSYGFGRGAIDGDYHGDGEGGGGGWGHGYGYGYDFGGGAGGGYSGNYGGGGDGAGAYVEGGQP